MINYFSVKFIALNECICYGQESAFHKIILVIKRNVSVYSYMLHVSVYSYILLGMFVYLKCLGFKAITVTNILDIITKNKRKSDISLGKYFYL